MFCPRIGLLVSLNCICLDAKYYSCLFWILIICLSLVVRQEMMAKCWCETKVLFVVFHAAFSPSQKGKPKYILQCHVCNLAFYVCRYLTALTISEKCLRDFTSEMTKSQHGIKLPCCFKKGCRLNPVSLTFCSSIFTLFLSIVLLKVFCVVQIKHRLGT